MKPFIASHLNNNEEIILEAKKHWLSLLPAFCYTLAAIILFFNMSNLASLFYYPPLASTIVKVWIFLVVIFLAYRAACDYLIFFTSELCFTDQRLIGKTGILRVRTLLTPLNKINHIASSTGILGTFFHYGNIQVHTSSGHVTYEQIVHHVEFINSLMEQMNQYEHEMTKGDDRPTLDKQSKPSFQTFAAPKASPDILDSPKKPVEVKSDLKGPVKGKPEPKNDDSKPAEQASLKLVTYCPNCSTPYTYTKGQEGQSAKCRKCGTSITIPKL